MTMLTMFRMVDSQSATRILRGLPVYDSSPPLLIAREAAAYSPVTTTTGDLPHSQIMHHSALKKTPSFYHFIKHAKCIHYVLLMAVWPVLGLKFPNQYV